MAITEITRRAIIDELKISDLYWWGDLAEPDFLDRIYPLSELPSYDPRFSDAGGDIWQHRQNNDDWQTDWVFTDPRFCLAHDDEVFLRFLAETVHPAVRMDQKQVRRLVEIYNRHLAPDGWELAEVAEEVGHGTLGIGWTSSSSRCRRKKAIS